jgi:hypothetical protein
MPSGVLTVVAETATPSPFNSPTIRRYPHRVFSFVSPRINATTDGSSGGRPSRVDGYLQRRATSRRCHPSNVSGRTEKLVHAARRNNRLKRSKKRPIGARQPRPSRLAPKNGHLVPQHRDLQILRPPCVLPTRSARARPEPPDTQTTKTSAPPRPTPRGNRTYRRRCSDRRARVSEPLRMRRRPIARGAQAALGTARSLRRSFGAPTSTTATRRVIPRSPCVSRRTASSPTVSTRSRSPGWLRCLRAAGSARTSPSSPHAFS